MNELELMVQKIDCKPGDVLVIRYDRSRGPYVIEKINQEAGILAKKLKVEIVVFPDDISLSVLTPAGVDQPLFVDGAR